METFITPIGAAGTDQLSAMEETIQDHIEQMFGYLAKRSSLDYGVGRAVSDGDVEQKIRLDAQKRGCHSRMMFHAGRGLELSLNLVYSRGMDCIPRREYQRRGTRETTQGSGSHRLLFVRNSIVKDMTNRPMEEALEDVYRQALHEGLCDVMVDGEKRSTVYFPNCEPFIEVVGGRLMDGAEQTTDNLSDPTDPIGFLWKMKDREKTEFEKMSDETFEQFLKKADTASYGKDMRWADYDYRDNQYGRPYVIIGALFFARLIKGIVSLSQEPWTWDEGFAQRFLDRRQRNIKKIVEMQLTQNFIEKVKLPEIKVDDPMKRWREIPTWLSERKIQDYGRLHKTIQV